MKFSARSFLFLSFFTACFLSLPAAAETFDINTLQAQAAKGDSDAEYRLGFLYEQGRGVPQDYPAAAQWWQKAAQQGDTHAQRSLATLYTSGHGVRKDDKEAARWYRLAAEGGYAKAQNDLGMIYETGQGVTQDTPEALKWLRLASEQGEVEAQHNLGLLYGDFLQPGMKTDLVESYFWLSVAAAEDEKYLKDRDATASQLTPPQADGVQKRVVDFFKQGAVTGDATAQCALGGLSLEGRGTAKDAALAEQLLLKSAQQGDYAAAAKLSELYFGDTYGKKNDQDAYFWALVAGKKGFAAIGANAEQYLTRDQIAALIQKAKSWKPQPAPAPAPAKGASAPAKSGP